METAVKEFCFSKQEWNEVSRNSSHRGFSSERTKLVGPPKSAMALRSRRQSNDLNNSMDSRRPSAPNYELKNNYLLKSKMKS